MIKTRLRGRNKPLFRTCKQSQPVQSHAKTALGVNEKIQSDIAVANANAMASLGVNGPLQRYSQSHHTEQRSFLPAAPIDTQWTLFCSTGIIPGKPVERP